MVLRGGEAIRNHLFCSLRAFVELELQRWRGEIKSWYGLIDACSRKIVGWAADDTMPTGLVARAFERAVAAHRPEPGLLHHSDRGSQYASDAYRELLRRHGVVASMSRAGNCYDNAKMESFWATMKTELIDGQIYATQAEAKSEIFRYIEVFYNRQRLHGALGFYSPVDFENQRN